MVPNDPFRPSIGPGGILPPLVQVDAATGRPVSRAGSTRSRRSERQRSTEPAPPLPPLQPRRASADSAAESKKDDDDEGGASSGSPVAVFVVRTPSQPKHVDLPSPPKNDEPEVDVFGKVIRTPPETLRACRRPTVRAEKRLSRESGGTLLLASPPPLGPLPAPPPQAAPTFVEGIEDSPVSVTTSRTTTTTPSSTTKLLAQAPKSGGGRSHRRNESAASQLSTAPSVKGTYFDDFQPVPSTLLTAPPAAPAVASTRDGPTFKADVDSKRTFDAKPSVSSATIKQPSTSLPKPRPLSQNVRSSASGSDPRRAPARPETADDPCLVLQETDYRSSNRAHLPSALRA